MKILLCFILFSMLNVSGSIFSQSATFDLAVNGKTVKEVFKDIEIQSDFRFLYNDDFTGLSRVVSFNTKDRNIDEVLNELLAGAHLTYRELENDLIVITPMISEQQRVVTGAVTDSQDDQPLPGVSIMIKGTTTGTVTDADGRYSISVPSEDAVLVFSFVGYSTTEVPVEGRSVIDVELITELLALDEIVVIGYGAQRKATLTGSVTAVRNEELTRGPTAISVSNVLEGLLPGVTAMNRTGRPGRNISDILVRGQSTTGNNSPLVLVDGVSYGDWQNLNSNDIESISVLKDASAAIYGARAANGVILITTKRGIVDKPTINYSFNQGINQLTRVPENAGSLLYIDFVNQRAEADGRPPFFSDEEIQKYKEGTDPHYANTDWYAETLSKYTPVSNHHLSMSGGTESLNYLISGSYSNENGILKAAGTYFKNYSLLGRFDADINPNIKVGLDMNYRFTDDYDEGDPFSTLAFVLPIDPVYWPNGEPSAGIENAATPITLATDRNGWDQRYNQRFSTKGSFDINIPLITGLGVDGYINYNQRGYERKRWQTPFEAQNYDRATGEYSTVSSAYTDARLTEYQTNSRSYLINFRVKYERQFNDHIVNTFIAAEQSEGYSKSFDAYRRNFLSEALPHLFAGGLSGISNSGSASESARQNVFGRFGYDFQGKYLAEFNFRYDGSSNFPPGNQWGFFPGGSVAWRISEESFMDNFDFIQNLKLRGSYGQLGNDAVPSYQWLSTYSINSNRGYAFGRSPNMQPGLLAGVSPNANITWEVAEMSNIALDALLWNELLGFELDFFKQTRSNILTKRDLAIPKFTGLALPDENIGSVENKGVELLLTHRRLLSADFSYIIGGNVAYAKNKVLDIDEAADIPEWQKAEGHAIGAPRYYIAKGIFRTQEEIDNTPHVPGTVTGDLIYEDVNGDGLISEADMVRMDKTNTPEVTFGLNLSMSYKRFSVWANFTGQTRAWQYIHKHSKGAGHNTIKELLENRYTPGSMDSKYPNIPDSEVPGMDISGYYSTFWLYDASYLRLKTLQLSYTLPEELLNRANISSMRVFINGFNLFTWDEIDWVDPEGDQWMGRFYPQNKIYNLGINVIF